MKEEQQPCDYCDKAKAILYCRADEARLCLSCDMHVHKANTVSSKHTRSLICNLCYSASSSILCPTHNEVYCSNCDFEAHVSVTHHDKRAVESFCGCPSAVELISLLGLGGNKNILKEENKDEVFNEESSMFWDVPHVVRLNDLIVPVNDDAVQRGIQVFDVPPLPKDRNQACGEQKEEILHQLREILKSENGDLSYISEEFEPTTEFHSQLPPNIEQQGDFFSDLDGNENFTTHELEASEVQWNNNDWQEATNPAIFPYDQKLENFSMETSFHQDKVENFQRNTYMPNVGNGDKVHSTVSGRIPLLTSKVGLEILCPDRHSVLSRYKEKRKARRYDKLIRYESRKARADSRTRIKGRFAKLNQDA